MKKFLITFILIIIFAAQSFSRGIIIGFDSTIVSIFINGNPASIGRLTENISAKYDNVIIHLGRKYPFTKSFFSDENARKNLRVFCDSMHSRNVKVYLWILDSYGSDNFINIFTEHKEIINDVFSGLDYYKIHFDGIAVDMEWINNPDGNNNLRYIEILKYLREKLGDRKLFAFAPLIDSRKVNSRRGYDIRKIRKYADNIIAMLYVVNSDLCISGYDRLQPCLNDSRISDLRKYFKRKKFMTAISLNQGIVTLGENGEYAFALPVKNENNRIFYKLKLYDTFNYKNYVVKVYNSITDFVFINDNGEREIVRQNDNVFFIKLRNDIINKEDIIWEFSLAEDFE